MSLTRRGISQLAARRMQRSNYPDATLQLPCNFIPAGPPFSPCTVQLSCALPSAAATVERSGGVGVTEGGLTNPTTSNHDETGRWTSRRGCFGSIRAEDEHQSHLPYHRFFLTASSWRLGQLLSDIFVSLIFAPFPDHSSIAILRERVLLPCNGAILQ